MMNVLAKHILLGRNIGTDERCTCAWDADGGANNVGKLTVTSASYASYSRDVGAAETVAAFVAAVNAAQSVVKLRVPNQIEDTAVIADLYSTARNPTITDLTIHPGRAYVPICIYGTLPDDQQLAAVLASASIVPVAPKPIDVQSMEAAKLTIEVVGTDAGNFTVDFGAGSEKADEFNINLENDFSDLIPNVDEFRWDTLRLSDQTSTVAYINGTVRQTHLLDLEGVDYLKVIAMGKSGTNNVTARVWITPAVRR